MATSMDPEREVISSGAGSLTTGSLARLAALGAAELAGRSAVVYVAEHGPSFAVALFASAGAGVPIVPLNFRLPDEELVALVAQHPQALVLADDPERFGSIDG